jgi:hypothetical protein
LIAHGPMNKRGELSNLNERKDVIRREIRRDECHKHSLTKPRPKRFCQFSKQYASGM